MVLEQQSWSVMPRAAEHAIAKTTAHQASPWPLAHSVSPKVALLIRPLSFTELSQSSGFAIPFTNAGATRHICWGPALTELPVDYFRSRHFSAWNVDQFKLHLFAFIFGLCLCLSIDTADRHSGLFLKVLFHYINAVSLPFSCTSRASPLPCEKAR